MDSYKIVVARYNENIDWLLSDLDNCIIYNKGDKLNIKNEFFLENVGRESDTYLNYIIKNYNNLPDIIIFTQANIADHIDNGNNDLNYLVKLKQEAIQYGKSIPRVVYYQDNNNPHYPWDKEWNIDASGNLLYYPKENYLNGIITIFYKWFENTFNINYPNPINIYSNGLFAVKKELILKNSIEYYKKLLLHINHHSNPVEGAYFERSWYYIFK